VSWTLPVDRVLSYYTVIDPAAESADELNLDDGGVAGPGCVSRALMENGDFDPKNHATGLIVLGPNRTGSDTLVNGDDLHTNLAAVGIVVGDVAGNLSKLSNIGCIHVTPTSGFWDAYKTEGGKAEPGCSCAIPGSSPTGGRAHYALPMVGVLGLLGLRRRRRRKHA
jgi:MYXO-CTERM domain-containing protein